MSADPLPDGQRGAPAPWTFVERCFVCMLQRRLSQSKGRELKVLPRPLFVYLVDGRGAEGIADEVDFAEMAEVQREPL